MDNIARKTNNKSSQPVPAGWYVTRTGPQSNIADFGNMVYSNKPHNLQSVQEATEVFRYNNSLSSGLPDGTLVTLNPFPLSSAAFDLWQNSKQTVSAQLKANPDLFDYLMTTTHEEQQMMSNFAEDTEKSGWLVGKDDIIMGMGLGLSGVSGHYATEQKYLMKIKDLIKELLGDAVKQHGKGILDKRNIKALEAFLKSNPKYEQLQKAITELPKFMSKNLGRLRPTAGIPYAGARYMRRQIFLPAYNPQKYCQSFASLLKNRIGRVGRIGAGATWLIPAGIALYNVYDAPPEKKVQTASRETVGIALGAAGTEVGIAGGAALTVLLGVSGVGEFLILAGLASAAGAGLYWAGTKLTDAVFDFMGWNK